MSRSCKCLPKEATKSTLSLEGDGNTEIGEDKLTTMISSKLMMPTPEVRVDYSLGQRTSHVEASLWCRYSEMIRGNESSRSLKVS